MTDYEDNFQEEHRECRALLVFAAPNIKSDLAKIYVDSALSYATVRAWIHSFKSRIERTVSSCPTGTPSKPGDELL